MFLYKVLGLSPDSSFILISLQASHKGRMFDYLNILLKIII